MSKLVNLMSFWKDNVFVTSNTMNPFIAEAHLDNKGALDIHFLRDMLEENISKAQVQKVYMEVFGTPLPQKFLYSKEETSIPKDKFLQDIYVPADYRNVRSWIVEVMFEHGEFLNRQDLFDWIMSTSKPKVYLEDLHD